MYRTLPEGQSPEKGNTLRIALDITSLVQLQEILAWHIRIEIISIHNLKGKIVNL